MKRLNEILNKFKGKKILVVGDVIIDKYISGRVSRISPEAPVPVVEVAKQSNFAGGASYVATHINNLGGTAYLTGVLGDDEDAGAICGILENENINTSGLIKDSERITISKTRVIGQHQQIVRIDREEKKHIDSSVVKKMLKYIDDVIGRCDAVIISDYGKGVVVPSVFSEVIKLGKKNRIPIAVDPKPTYCLAYKNVTVITPNTTEAGSSVHKQIVDDETLREAGNELLKKTNSKSVLITRGEQGMSLFEKGKKVRHIETFAKEVYDVTGAGDTVISVLALALSTGASIFDSAYLSNIAAGIVVGKLGTAKVTIREIKELLNEK